MIPASISAITVIAAVLAMGAAAASCYLVRERRRWSPPQPDLADLERAVEQLVQRLETTAGRCIHDLESRQAELRRLMADDFSPRELIAAATRAPADASPAATCDYFETDLVGRSARVAELVEQAADEATICRTLGLQRAELRLLLSLGAPQPHAA